MSVFKKEGTSEYSDPPGEGHVETEALLSQDNPGSDPSSFVPSEGTTSQTLSCVPAATLCCAFLWLAWQTKHADMVEMWVLESHSSASIANQWPPGSVRDSV